uniref:EBNA1 binding protein 2 n=1 Tax=Callithrix jacchus TaxID=9483 RepID=A0A5F4W0V0_CALJA
MDTPPLSGSESESDDSLVTDRELQDAFSRGLLKPGLNVVLEGPKKAVNDVNGLKQCLAEFKRDLEWVERLDVTLGPVPEIGESEAPTLQNKDQKAVDPEDDFQREMSFYRQAQAAVLAVLPRLHQLKVPTKRPTDYFAEMAKSDLQMQKIRQKLQTKQAAMEKSEKAKQLRALRKYGKKVQTEVLQKRQQEKAHMMNAIKKYQKGFSDKLDFLEGDQKPPTQGKKAGAKGQQMKKGPSAKRRYKNQKFGFGGKKKGSKWNTRESYDDISSFRAKTAHGRGLKRPGKKGSNVSEPRCLGEEQAQPPHPTSNPPLSLLFCSSSPSGRRQAAM